EKWTGNYVYGEPYPEGIKGLSVPFTIEWIDKDGILTGTCTDDETKMYFDRPAAIKGFIDDGMISFIKTYPCRCEIDAAGHVTLFEREPAIDIHYSGTWVDDHFEGEWDMTISYQTEDGFPKEYECTGVWALYKEGDAPVQSLPY
ncbi:MAG: hypothetical protein J7621_19585, partial [Niastella sp.]|nr:hypothetical protein [Niastella sp.]